MLNYFTWISTVLFGCNRLDSLSPDSDYIQLSFKCSTFSILFLNHSKFPLHSSNSIALRGSKLIQSKLNI